MTSVRKIIREFTKDPQKGLIYGCSCDNGLCITAEHIKARKNSEQKRHMANRALLSGTRAMKIATTRRAQSPRNPEEIAEIRSSTESAQVVADRHGMSRHMVWRIRAGRSWKDYSSPWAGL